jgi:hypothetical protein
MQWNCPAVSRLSNRDHIAWAASEAEPRWSLSSSPALQKSEVPRSRGTLTIAHIGGLDDPVEYGRAVAEWARAAWDAYGQFHPVAREWTR